MCPVSVSFPILFHKVYRLQNQYRVRQFRTHRPNHHQLTTYLSSVPTAASRADPTRRVVRTPLSATHEPGPPQACRTPAPTEPRRPRAVPSSTPTDNRPLLHGASRAGAAPWSATTMGILSPVRLQRLKRLLDGDSFLPLRALSPPCGTGSP
ncbi:putative serine/arginine-rich splicing factor SR45 isoform X1 [Iris pallida]|uniref:Serine/arginine-rich splicing factor SR45 isoform X1 n=1 Tax=Iris pallida TaxID=29817 RepID=A0AAX6GZQ0_IRIPA|nr:putative serine/arginine-rich splicing factor SR45 isoform X1 [Iris pallida]KAJ6834044.1 putative serine/arginine-rich splicing factor SR45 isoform X1 [Iris pallida]